MAIIGITPTFMSPIAYRNFAPELEQQTRSNAAGLQQLANFATKAYDYNKNRQIGDALKRGNVAEAAELESQKINQQDPTMLWRWKAGQDQQQAQINAANAQRIADEQKAKQNLMNETESLLSNVVTDNPEAMAQYINNLNTQKAKLRNMGIDTKIVDDKIKQMSDAMQGRKADIAQAQTSTDLLNGMDKFDNTYEMKEYFDNNKENMSNEDKWAAIDKLHKQRIKDSNRYREHAMKLRSNDAQAYLDEHKSEMLSEDIAIVKKYIKEAKPKEIITGITEGKTIEGANDERWADGLFGGKK